MNGLKAREEILRLCPRTPTMLASGYSDEMAARSAPDNTCFISKPYDVGTLLRSVRDVLDATRAPEAGAPA